MRGTIGTFLALGARSFRRSIRCDSTKMARSINSLSACGPSRWPRSLPKSSFEDFSLRWSPSSTTLARELQLVDGLATLAVALLRCTFHKYFELSGNRNRPSVVPEVLLYLQIESTERSKHTMFKSRGEVGCNSEWCRTGEVVTSR